MQFSCYFPPEKRGLPKSDLRAVSRQEKDGILRFPGSPCSPIGATLVSPPPPQESVQMAARSAETTGLKGPGESYFGKLPQTSI